MRYLSALCLCLSLLVGCGGGGDPTGSSRLDTVASATATESESAEASIEGFGEEASGSDREALMLVFHGYLEAIAGGDREAACSYLGGRVRYSLEQLASKAKKSPSCAELLGVLLSPEANEIAKSQDEGQVRKVRLQGDTAFIVFHAPGARLFQMNLGREGDEWKVTSLSASVLAPELRH
jgi:hypothetical protein